MRSARPGRIWADFQSQTWEREELGRGSPEPFMAKIPHDKSSGQKGKQGRGTARGQGQERVFTANFAQGRAGVGVTQPHLAAPAPGATCGPAISPLSFLPPGLRPQSAPSVLSGFLLPAQGQKEKLSAPSCSPLPRKPSDPFLDWDPSCQSLKQNLKRSSFTLKLSGLFVLFCFVVGLVVLFFFPFC